MKTFLRLVCRAFLALVVLLLLALAVGRERLELLAIWGAGKLAAHASAGCVLHSPEAVPALETGIVPGASIRSPHLRARAETAAALYHAGKVRQLLLSGDGREPSYNEPAALRAMLRDLGVPDAAMTEDAAGLATWETLERARRVHGVRRAVVITQEFHSARVALLAGYFNLDVTICCTAGPADTRRDEAREARARVRAVLDICGLRRWTATCESDRRVQVGKLELARW